MCDMETIRNWLLPALLAAGQVAWLWPGAALTGGEVPGPAGIVGVLCALAVETVALGRRRQAPVRALAGALGALALGQVASPDYYFGLGAPIALYSVAVRCPVPVTVRAVAAAVGTEWLLSLARLGFHPSLASETAISAVVYVVCAGLGEARRQWLAGRLTAARRLAGAENSRQRAGDNERQRLARELHDVSAHQLTSVVVTVDAARRLGGSRPEMTAEARSFAERTGTETLTALRQLVGLMRATDRPGLRPMTGRIEELVAGFGRLGPTVAMEIPDDLAGPAAEAVHGIVREALTNALRHAPGAAVRVDVRRANGLLELTVDNAAPRAPATHGAGDLGAGRGVLGMKERAAATGGELTAGPGPAGGWRVRATLPDNTGPRTPAAHGWRRDVLREQRLADPALAFTATVLPLFVALAAAEDWTEGSRRAGLPGMLVLSALLALHALPLLWRRRAPWAALTGVLATAWLWPVAVAGAAVSPRLSPFLAGGVLAETAAVYAVAGYGRGPARTWPAVPVATVGVASVLTVTAAADGALAGEDASWFSAALMTVLLCAVLCPLFALLWGAGLAVRRRRRRVLAHDDFELADSVWQAERAADAERRRLAAKVQDAVLHRTATLVELARQGRLDEVAAEARSALTAMRELLHSLGGTEDPGQRLAPSRTAADLEALCHTLRSTGRDVTLRGLPEAAADLSPAVALSTYRIVETALGAGDRGPARVTLRRRRSALHLTVSGVRLAVVGPVAERLRVQVATGEGRITLEPAGTVRVSLPAGPRPAPVQEVSPSPYA